MSLWNGTKASLMLVSNPAIKFTVYELLKRHYTRASGRTVSGLGAFILGCIATATATLATYPIQVLQVRGEVITMNFYSLFIFAGQGETWVQFRRTGENSKEDNWSVWRLRILQRFGHQVDPVHDCCRIHVYEL